VLVRAPDKLGVERIEVVEVLLGDRGIERRRRLLTDNRDVLSGEFDGHVLREEVRLAGVVGGTEVPLGPVFHIGVRVFARPQCRVKVVFLPPGRPPEDDVVVPAVELEDVVEQLLLEDAEGR